MKKIIVLAIALLAVGLAVVSAQTAPAGATAVPAELRGKWYPIDLNGVVAPVAGLEFTADRFILDPEDITGEGIEAHWVKVTGRKIETMPPRRNTWTVWCNEYRIENGVLSFIGGGSFVLMGTTFVKK